MNPIAFTIGPVTIRWYGIMIACGLMAGMILLQRNRKHADLRADQVSDVVLYTVISGILGARIFYVLQFWNQFKYNPAEIIRIDHGGLVFYGGFICALFTTCVYCKWKKISIPKLLDIYGPSLALAHAFGRIGCFMNGCCFGKPSNFWGAVQFPQGSVPANVFPFQKLYPVQLYETFCNILLFILLQFCIKKLKPGQTAALYAVGYGILRLGIEFFRGDHKNLIFNVLTPAQFISLLMIPAGVVFLICRQKSDETKKKVKLQNSPLVNDIRAGGLTAVLLT